ncbi:hypothetical protein [Aeromicrobium alkaliterrae]|uniref:hypothetical protein n=1 Tax=Aeromicrobium alkaliterrae TaxID=302168 RepID=UPI0031E00B48
MAERYRTRFRHLPLPESTSRPRGEVTMNIVLDADLSPAQLTDVMKRVRQDLTDPELVRYAVSINYTQPGRDRRIFDGWGVPRPPVPRSDDELGRIADFALGLPDGAWFDLDPATFEQGQFTDAEPPPYADLLGLEVDESYTVGVGHDSASTSDVLDEAVRLTDSASAALDGPTVVHVVGGSGARVLTTTDPARLTEALRQISALLAQADAVATPVVSFTAEREMTVGDDSDGTVTASLTIGTPNDCARDDAPSSSFASAASTVLDEHGIEHTVEWPGCP